MNNKFIKNTQSEKQNVCSVCIATFKRPALLRKLIQSLFEQKKIDDIILEIIIVDNDDEESSKEIVAEFPDQTSITVSYYKQPIQNIALTRNMSIDKSSGHYIAIIDDDETADNYWIKNLIDTIVRFNADVVFGYVIPVFDSNIAQWMKQREIYFAPMGKTGDPALHRYTTNCLIKANNLRKLNLRFNPEYGLGGSDGVFFDLLFEYKFKFVDCKEAITYEVVPKHRAKLKFIFNRDFQRGNNIVWHAIETGNNKFQKIKFFYFIRSLVAIAYYGLQSLFFLPFRRKWIFSFRGLSFNLGKLMAILNFKLRKYKTKYN